MEFVFFLVGLVIAYFVWKKTSTFHIKKGRNKFLAHFTGASVGFFAWLIILVIGVVIFPPKDTQNNEVTLETKESTPKKSDDLIQFEADQAALKKYLNAVSAETTYVDSIIQNVGHNLASADIYSASSSASRCIDAVKVIQLDLASSNQLKPIELSNEEKSDVLKDAIQNLSLGYYMHKGYCEAVKEFLDTQKPSLVVEAKEKSNDAQSMIIGAVGQIMTVASAYKLTFKDGEWKSDEINSTK